MGEKLVKLQPLMEICGFLPCFLLTAYPKNLDKRSMKAFVLVFLLLCLNVKLVTHNSQLPSWNPWRMHSKPKKSQIFLQFLTVQIACLSLGYGLQRKKKCFSTFLNSISDCIENLFKDFKALNNPITWKFSDLGRFCLMSNQG